MLPATMLISPRKVQELHQQMAHLLSQQQHNKPNSDSMPNHPFSTLQSPNNNHSQVFIAQVTTAVASVTKLMSDFHLIDLTYHLAGHDNFATYH